MSSTTRFPNGVTNVGEDSIFAQIGQLDPTQYHTYWEDFDYFVSSDWTVTASGTTPALIAADGGVYAIDDPTGSATGDAEVSKNFGSFTFEPGKRMWFKVRLKSLDPTAGKIVVLLNSGFVAEAIGFFSGLTLPVNLIQFLMFTGQNPTATVDVGTLPTDEYTTLGWYYDGNQTISVFQDERFVVSVSLATSAPPSSATPMEPKIAHVPTGSGDPAQSAFDYIFVAKER